MNNPSALIQLGRIGGAHGVHGWVKLQSDCRPPQAILKYPTFTARRAPRPDITLTLAESRQQGDVLLARFTGVADRDHALSLRGLALFVPRNALPCPTEGEYYWADLIDLSVINRDGETLGRVRSLFETGANDVLIVADEQGDELLIPFIRPDYIEAIDLEGGKIHVDWQRAWSQNS